ncbi:DUF4296 domain-containing protein [Paraflavitalea pollutisoli]|uniref:DUF4296 domain-containing protein n=1 Tax=Paraflavitalea pollutisoli TaxID=3034143 RepID=UPI0023EDCCE6|nr:DUF4296 domain-containing protein [Paraflavitalea sp. H1-2-19X]
MIRKRPLTVLANSFFYGMVFLLIAGAVACTNRNKIPSDVMNQEKMEAVMWDMIQADRFSSQFLERDSTAKKNIKLENLQMYERVFQLHKISRDEFIRSFNFYLSRPDLHKVVFDSMSVRAERRRSELYKMDTAR